MIYFRESSVDICQYFDTFVPETKTIMNRLSNIYSKPNARGVLVLLKF